MAETITTELESSRMKIHDYIPCQFRFSNFHFQESMLINRNKFSWEPCNPVSPAAINLSFQNCVVPSLHCVSCKTALGTEGTFKSSSEMNMQVCCSMKMRPKSYWTSPRWKLVGLKYLVGSCPKIWMVSMLNVHKYVALLPAHSYQEGRIGSCTINRTACPFITYPLIGLGINYSFSNMCMEKNHQRLECVCKFIQMIPSKVKGCLEVIFSLFESNECGLEIFLQCHLSYSSQQIFKQLLEASSWTKCIKIENGNHGSYEHLMTDRQWWPLINAQSLQTI